MKFLLVPLLIIGMFVSFAAAMLAMLFFTETVKTKEELEKIIRGEVDASRLSDEFIDPEDKLGKLAGLLDEYRQQYEADTRMLRDSIDSLDIVQANLAAQKMMLDAQEQRLMAVGDSTREATRLQNLEGLIPVYDKRRADPAADILSSGTLDDTTVAMIMQRLQPQQMAKIMQSMTPAFAAEITKIIQEL